MRRFAMSLAPALTMLILTVISATGEEAFPLRKEYPQVNPISTRELAEKYDAVKVVDVRSAIEYDVVHVNKAVHIPVASRAFLAELEKVRSKNGSEPFVFYCNGHTCAKSYKAAVKAMAAGFQNVYCYDAGIYEWVNVHPEKATLMSRTPAQKEALISDQTFKARKIPYAGFEKKAAEPNTVVIDVREPFQRATNPELPQNKLLKLAGVRNIPSDRLAALLKKKEFKDRQLLIADAVGKQVRWLQYYLEDNGYRNYYFLNEGVLGAAKAGGVR